MEDNREKGITDIDVTQQFIVTNLMHRRILEKNLERYGLHRGQHRILMTLACREIHSQVDLARELEVSPAAIAVSLKALEKEGFITRTMNKNDNRVNFVEVTDKAKKIIEDSNDYFYRLDKRMYEGFSVEERKELYHYLERIYRNMEQMEVDNETIQ